MRDYIIIPNQRNITIKITRGQLCSLIIACSIMGDELQNTRFYWRNLRDKLKEQLDKHDEIYREEYKI